MRRPGGSGKSQSQSYQRPYLPKELFEQMSKEAQMWWMRNPKLDGKYPKYKSNSHEVDYGEEIEDEASIVSETEDNDIDEDAPDDPERGEDQVDSEEGSVSKLQAFLSNQKSISPGDIRKVLANVRSTSGNKKKLKAVGKPQDKRKVLNINGKNYREINTLKYIVSKHESVKHASLVDRGANGGLAGSDVRIIETTPRKVDISGIDNHEVTGLDIVTAAGYVETQKGPVIAILHQYAHLGKGKSIHSSGQLEYYKNQVDDRSRVVGGGQCIKTLDGYFMPLKVQNGLPYLSMRPPTDNELDSLPHVVLTSDDDWNPNVLDSDFDLEADWSDIPSIDPYDDPDFDVFG